MVRPDAATRCYRRLPTHAWLGIGYWKGTEGASGFELPSSSRSPTQGRARPSYLNHIRDWMDVAEATASEDSDDVAWPRQDVDDRVWNLAVPDIDVRTFARLAERLQADPTPSSMAEDVIGYLRVQLEADHASITVVHSDRELETIAASSSTAEELDRLQYDLVDGPSYQNSWPDQTLLSADLAADARWPAWGPRAAALGVRSILAAELTTQDGRRIGSLNCYWNRARRPTDDDIAFVGILARHAALALSTAWGEAQLNVELDSRKLIGRAEGVLMERYGVDEARASEVLHRYSQDNNLELRDVAIHLIDSRRLPPLDDSST